MKVFVNISDCNYWNYQSNIIISISYEEEYAFRDNFTKR